ncbi:MAG: hypothetical protein Q8S73_41985 [Deltaproteobacteria bacterium]|nr:hypothetical protein [Deltaproteobacteria bacterium]
MSGVSNVRRIVPQMQRSIAVSAAGTLDEVSLEPSRGETSVRPFTQSQLAGVVEVAVPDVPDRWWILPAFARTADGAVYGWNLLDHDGSRPHQVPQLPRVTDLRGGEGEVCARDEDGAIWCWNAFTAIEERDQAYDESASPPPARIEAFGRVAGFARCHLRLCAWTAAGALRCREHDTAPVLPVRVDDVVDVALAESSACARLRDGRVSCWGRGRVAGVELSNDPREVPQLRGAEEVTLDQSSESDEGPRYVGGLGCARWPDGSVRCWGSDVGGALATGTTLARPDLIGVIGLRDAIAVTTGDHHACALRGDATVACWGANDHGQLGDGTHTQRGVAAPVPRLDTVVEITAGGDHTCARRANGEAWCWGDNDAGEVGAGFEKIDFATPTRVVGVSGALELSAGRGHSCVREDGGVVRCWGRFGGGWPGAPRVHGALAPLSVALPAPVMQLFSYDRSVCAMESDRALHCWGLADGGAAPPTDPRSERIEVRDVLGLSAGPGAPCYAWDRAGRVWSFVAGPGGGQVGDPFEVPQGVLGVVATSEGQVCAHTPEGTVACWYGAGDRADDRAHPPATRWVPGLTDVTDLTAGDDFICARRRGGSVACWGANHHGQLGDGRSVARDVPELAMH